MASEKIQAGTLKAHREALARNPAAYVADLPRVRNTAVHHLKKCGFVRVTRVRCSSIVDRFVDAIFDTQDRLPFFPRGQSSPVLLERTEGLDERLHPIRMGPSLLAKPERGRVSYREHLLAISAVQPACPDFDGYRRSAALVGGLAGGRTSTYGLGAAAAVV